MSSYWLWREFERAGRPLSSRYVRWLMADLGAKAQIGKRVHAHGLRHTRLAEMAREGIPVHIISRAAGHSNVATTDRYIMHLNPQMELCGARHDDVTPIRCELEAGHKGNHEGNAWIDWPREDE